MTSLVIVCVALYAGPGDLQPLTESCDLYEDRNDLLEACRAADECITTRTRAGIQVLRFEYDAK